jgi:hypothetical protein
MPEHHEFQILVRLNLSTAAATVFQLILSEQVIADAQSATIIFSIIQIQMKPSQRKLGI